MAHEYHTFQIKSPADGLMIDCLEYRTPSEPKAVVQMAHGMCEYKDRYIPLMEFLSAHGYICIMNDHRGHGKSIRSMDDLGHFYEPGGQGLITDMLAVTDYIQKTYPDLPLLMFGHSMGSFAVRTYIKEHDDLIKGLIVCGSPSDTPARGMGKVILNILKVFKGAHGKSRLADSLFSTSFNKNFKDLYGSGSRQSLSCGSLLRILLYDQRLSVSHVPHVGNLFQKRMESLQPRSSDPVYIRRERSLRHGPCAFSESRRLHPVCRIPQR